MQSSNSKLFYKQRQLITEILPFSATTLWRKVKSGDFPAPIKLGSTMNAWKAEDVAAWIKKQEAASCKKY
jgi:prophage regulatory protein